VGEYVWVIDLGGKLFFSETNDIGVVRLSNQRRVTLNGMRWRRLTLREFNGSGRRFQNEGGFYADFIYHFCYSVNREFSE
jgi:hypothetical protein